MNKLYFSIDTPKCGYPNLKSPKDSWIMTISTVVHNYISYRFKLNANAFVSNKRIRKQLSYVIKNTMFYGTKYCSYILKSLIVSLIQNQGHDFSAIYYVKNSYTGIIDNQTGDMYLNGCGFTKMQYKYFFQILKTSHSNFFNIKIWDPDYSLSKKDIESAIELNKQNYRANIERLKENPISFKTQNYEVDISFDEKDKEETLITNDVEVYSKNHLKVTIRERIDCIKLVDKLKCSKYNVFLNDGYIFNTWSGSLILLEKEKVDELKKNCFDGFSTLEIDNLKKLGIITNIENEFEAVRIQNVNYIKNDKKFSIVIAPTTKCNANCSYCFEKGIKAIDLDDSIIEKIVNYIEEASNKRKVHITWFGGEPLMGSDGINKICDLLKKRKIDFSSSMISNGYLFDNFIAIAKSNWNLHRVQITLDDLYEHYDLIKRLGKNSFEKVITNIHLLLANNIEVSIRVNFNASNYNDSLKIIDFIKSEFGNRVHLYYHDIVGEEYKSPNEIKPNPMIEISKKLMDNGFASNLPDLKIKRSMTPCGLEKENFLNVFPDGNTTRCEHYIGKNSEYSSGNLNNIPFSPKVYKKQLYKMCKYCICFPICGGGCDSNHKIRKGYGCTRIKTGLVEILNAFIERKIQK